MARNRTVRYEFVGSMLDRLRHTYSSDTDEDVQSWMTWYESRHLMILDDLGLEKGSDWTIEKVTTLVDGRMRKGQRTAIATNKTQAELRETVGSRLTSRLYATNLDLDDVRLISTTARDYRQ